jgi:HAE1 family hydrophobic/amphiphilic exporter-1
MIPLSTLVETHRVVAPPLISLYNLYPAATILGQPAASFSSGQALALMDEIAAGALPAGAASDWTAMSYQEKLVGGQIYVVFGLGLLLVYLVLAGQYESWLAPLAVVLSVPLALTGPVALLSAVGAANNLYTQIGIVLLIALAAKNAILIVEVARERHAAGVAVLEAAVAAARARFRAILMTSLAFILGVLPLVFATGAGANARRSIGVAVASGMLASTCLAVLFVPAFFVVLQRIEDRLKARRTVAAVTT